MPYSVRGLKRRQVGCVATVTFALEILRGGNACWRHIKVARGSKQQHAIPICLSLQRERMKREQRPGVVHCCRAQLRHAVGFKPDPSMRPGVHKLSVPEDFCRQVGALLYSWTTRGSGEIAISQPQSKHLIVFRQGEVSRLLTGPILQR